MTSRKSDDDDVEAIRCLVRVQDTLEQAGRPDGEIVQLTRQDFDDAIDNLRAAARAICRQHERRR
jgi:hypothetical protein